MVNEPAERKIDNPLDEPGPWDADVTAILASAGFLDGGVSWPGPIRRFMCEAWRQGYTTGMADAAQVEVALRTAQHVITVEGPIAYPGGKDGMFLARCICGEWASAIDTEPEVRKAGAAHVRDKR